MKKLLLAWVLLLLLAACADSTSSPVIELTKCFVNDDGIDYAKRMETLPSLQKGDEVTLLLKLDGRGEELNTFLVKEKKEEEQMETMKITFVGPSEDQLSEDKEFTDQAKGKLGFTDGVNQIQFEIKAKVIQVVNQEVTLLLYLFSKPADCEGAKLELKLKMAVEVDK